MKWVGNYISPPTNFCESWTLQGEEWYQYENSTWRRKHDSAKRCWFDFVLLTNILTQQVKQADNAVTEFLGLFLLYYISLYIMQCNIYYIICNTYNILSPFHYITRPFTLKMLFFLKIYFKNGQMYSAVGREDLGDMSKVFPPGSSATEERKERLDFKTSVLNLHTHHSELILRYANSSNTRLCSPYVEPPVPAYEMRLHASLRCSCR